MRRWFNNRPAEEPGEEIDPAKTVVLFVCTANLGRSPMAEAMFRALLGHEARWHVLSAGTKSANGFAPTPEALTVLHCHGCDTTRLRTRRLETWMLERADYIFVMGEVHEKSVLRMLPEAREKCFRLRDFEDREADRAGDVPDPHEKPLDAYLEVHSVLQRLLPRALAFIEEGPSDAWRSWHRNYRQA